MYIYNAMHMHGPRTAMRRPSEQPLRRKKVFKKFSKKFKKLFFRGFRPKTALRLSPLRLGGPG